MNVKHIFFDLDNTLTRSKSHIESEHAGILKRLTERADVIVVSGHDEGSIIKHLGSSLGHHYYVLAQNGNFAQAPDGTMLWKHKLGLAQVRSAHKFIEKARAHLALHVKDENDIVEDRGCEIAYSLIGHHENIETKEAFDPDGSKRKKLLNEMRRDVEMLESLGVEIRIGGTTVLDFMEKGKNKGYNVAKLIKTLGWKKAGCVYVGDALFPGGNDETVIGVIPAKPVADYRETYVYIEKLLAKS